MERVERKKAHKKKQGDVGIWREKQFEIGKQSDRKEERRKTRNTTGGPATRTRNDRNKKKQNKKERERNKKTRGSFVRSAKRSSIFRTKGRPPPEPTNIGRKRGKRVEKKSWPGFVSFDRSVPGEMGLLVFFGQPDRPHTRSKQRNNRNGIVLHKQLRPFFTRNFTAFVANSITAH